MKATIDLVTGAVEQGEKVIVFSCFEEPVQQIVEAFRGSAVLLTGETPAKNGRRWSIASSRTTASACSSPTSSPAASAHNLTAATQVVFNDLDWVPANHWQAEDRAYRIGQSRTVNVTYMVAADTIDDFVQSVLEKKARLVSAIVDGKAMAQDRVRRRARRAAARAARVVVRLRRFGVRRWTASTLIERLLRQARLNLDGGPEPR